MSAASMRSGARAGEQIAVLAFGMAHADVAEGIHDSLVGQDAVGGDELVDEVFQLGHDVSPEANIAVQSMQLR